MDFTREPIVETVITPKEGWTLVIRSSKGVGQEEYFVDAIEVVTFGTACFYRSQERPKAFMVPVADYEVVEVRETRLVLKNITLDRSIKIGSGKEFAARAAKEPANERVERPVANAAAVENVEMAPPTEGREDASVEARLDKKRDRKRNFRRKRAREEVAFREEEGAQPTEPGTESGTDIALPALTSAISSLLTPPPALISDTIALYKENALFKGAFFSKEEAAAQSEQAEGCEEPAESLSPEEDLELPKLPEMSLDFPIYGAENMPVEKQDVPAMGLDIVEQADQAELLPQPDLISAHEAIEAATLPDAAALPMPVSDDSLAQPEALFFFTATNEDALDTASEESSDVLEFNFDDDFVEKPHGTDDDEVK